MTYAADNGNTKTRFRPSLIVQSVIGLQIEFRPPTPAAQRGRLFIPVPHATRQGWHHIRTFMY